MNDIELAAYKQAVDLIKCQAIGLDRTGEPTRGYTKLLCDARDERLRRYGWQDIAQKYLQDALDEIVRNRR